MINMLERFSVKACLALPAENSVFDAARSIAAERKSLGAGRHGLWGMVAGRFGRCGAMHPGSFSHLYRIGQAIHMLTAFYDFADLLVRKSDAHPAPAALDNQALAITMLSCVHDHTSSWQIFKDKAAQLQAEIAGTLPAELHTTAMMRGQTCALEELVKTLLGEVEAS